MNVKTELVEEVVPLKSRIAISAGDAATAILQSLAAAQFSPLFRNSVYLDLRYAKNVFIGYNEIIGIN